MIFEKTWFDYNLQWDPKKFGNITSICVPSKNIWIPGEFKIKRSFFADKKKTKNFVSNI